jgi:hypothetical protein
VGKEKAGEVFEKKAAGSKAEKIVGGLVGRRWQLCCVDGRILVERENERKRDRKRRTRAFENSEMEVYFSSIFLGPKRIL